RNDAHADQVCPMDTFEALGNHGTNSDQCSALGSPIARRSGAIALAGKNNAMFPPAAETLRQLVQWQMLARSRVHTITRRNIGRNPVDDASIGEKPAYHDFEVAPA